MNVELAYKLTYSLHTNKDSDINGNPIGFFNNDLEEEWDNLSKAKRKNLIKFAKNNSYLFNDLNELEVSDYEILKEQNKMIDDIYKELVDELDFVTY